MVTLRRRTPLRRRKGLNPRSERKREVDDHRRLMRMVASTLNLRCEFPDCSEWAVDWHERLPRSQGGSPVHPSNQVWLCRAHHDWVHSHPVQAHELGLRRWSWEGEG